MMNKYIIKYETKLLLKNYATIFFGLVFPLIMASLIIVGVGSKLPIQYVSEAKRSITLTINIISPLSIFLIGHASITAKDMEEGVYDRLELFSIKQFVMAKYKFLIYYIFFLICTIIYFLIIMNAFNVEFTMIELLRHTIYVSLIDMSSFFLAYAICLYTKKYSLSFGLTMVLYFLTMILSGMMGISVDDMPESIRYIARAIPTSHFSSAEYLDEISKGIVNYTFIQGLILLILISLIMMVLATRKNKRRDN